MTLEFNPKTNFLRVDRAFFPLDINRIVIELDHRFYLARYYFHDDIPGTGNNKLRPTTFKEPRENWIPFSEAEYWVYSLEHKQEAEKK